MASDDPPAAVLELNEAGFEAAALAAFRDLGPATPEALDRMLAAYGF